jgi:endonuclease-3
LKAIYSDAKCSLDFKSPYELLVATILSAQCTDKRVNMVTPELFKRYPSPQKMAVASQSDVETLIRSTGFYKNKAKNIIQCCKDIVTKHDGRVPKTMEELSNLAGVGRKTANVVLGNAFGVPGMVVDTHVTRITNLLGLSKGKDAVKIEKQLEMVIEKSDWIIFSHLLIEHGRQVCIARRPQCSSCQLLELCPRIGI